MVRPDSFIAVYMMTNRPRGTLYVGVTSRLLHRIGEHREGLIEGSFTRKYGLKRLVWFEHFERMEHAIVTEKRMKRWPREYKYNTVEASNPYWIDLYPSLVESFGYEKPSAY